MTGSRHERSIIEAFLNDDFRQVWAVDRVSGQPRFLPDGEAKAFRTVAKSDWRCPVPDCEVEITTVGGSSRRHHFRHNQPSPHASDGESEFHLAAKAMLAAWAEQRKPVGATVQEERSTQKNPETSRYRTADVMVDWLDGAQTAIEVEYKQYAPEAWDLKQGDYDQHQPEPIACVWLFGHLRIKRAPKNSYAAQDPTVVRIPLLGQRWVKAGRPVLVINPVTREVGTILAEHSWDGMRHPRPEDTYGRLFVDSIEQCHLDPVRGIVTPAMLQVEAAEAKRERERQAALQKAAQERAAHEAKQNRIAELQQRQTEAWNGSDLHRTFHARWATLPALLTTETKMQYGVWGHPTHWHGVIYEEHILSKTSAEPFTLTDLYKVMESHGIRRHYTPKVAFQAVMAFMERLQHYGVVSIHRNERGYIECFRPTGTTIEAAEATYQAHLEQIHLDGERRRQAQAARERVAQARLAAQTMQPTMTFAERVAAASSRRPLQAPARPATEASVDTTGGRPANTPATSVPDPDREIQRSQCARCAGPLPSWQRGGYHTMGCP